MAETISPVVHGGRTKTYWSALLAHAAGAGIAAGAVGAALGAAGALVGLGRSAPYAIAIVAVLYLVREGMGVPIPIPAGSRQVPEWWRTFFGPRAAALLYGLGLGTGFLTPLKFGTFVVVAAGALASGDPLLGAAVAAPFGFARALVVAVAPPPTIGTFDRGWVAGPVNVVSLALVASASLIAAL